MDVSGYPAAYVVGSNALKPDVGLQRDGYAPPPPPPPQAPGAGGANNADAGRQRSPAVQVLEGEVLDKQRLEEREAEFQEQRRQYEQVQRVKSGSATHYAAQAMEAYMTTSVLNGTGATYAHQLDIYV